MKILFYISFLLSSIFANAQVPQNTDFALARVGKQIYGVYVFVNSQPYFEYDYVATVSVKVTWSGSAYESFEKAIKKAKQEFPNFNGMIFHNDNYSKVDLIKFKGLEITHGGFKQNDRVSFIKNSKLFYGEIVELETYPGRASVQYINDKAKTDIEILYYKELTLSPEEKFEENKGVLPTSTDLNLKIGASVSWIENSLLLGKFEYQGTVLKTDDKNQKALVKPENSKARWVNYTELNLQ